MYFRLQLPAASRKMLLDGVTEKDADIAELDIARGIAPLCGCQQLLPGTLGDSDHCMAALLQPLLQMGEEAVEGKGNLRHQAEIYLTVDQGRDRRR